MTAVLIGTYRRRDYIEQCLRSLDEQVSGVTSITFIDDSGDSAHARWLAQYGTVVDLPQVGYMKAYEALCANAHADSFVLEEDFTFLEPISLDELGQHLQDRPYLAQVALLRGPHYPPEHRWGGVIQALLARGFNFNLVDGLIEHTATFTCNPSMWRAEVFALGWPQTAFSENVKRHQLLAHGYRFAYLPGIRVAHHGINSGHSY